MGDAIAQAVESSNLAVHVALPIRTSRKGLVEIRHPDRLFVGRGAEKAPEAEGKLGNHLAWRARRADPLTGLFELVALPDVDVDLLAFTHPIHRTKQRLR